MDSDEVHYLSTIIIVYMVQIDELLAHLLFSIQRLMEYMPFLCKDRKENTWHLIDDDDDIGDESRIDELMMVIVELMMIL